MGSEGLIGFPTTRVYPSPPFPLQPPSAEIATVNEAPFWKRKQLSDLDREEWESLCDGCGRCCLHKLQDVDTRELFYTDVACRLLDLGRCRCTQYSRRRRLVPDCIVFTPEDLEEIDCMPPSCAYRLLHEGKDLPWWHHLVSGDPELVHEVGISVRGRAVSETGLSDQEIEERIVKWPQSRKIRGAMRRRSSRRVRREEG